MKRFWIFTLLFGISLLALTACLGRSPSAGSPTPSPVVTIVTATAVVGVVPTGTLPPTTATQPPAPTEAAPSPTAIVATPAPTVPATPDPNEGVGDVLYADHLNGSDGWGWTFADDSASFSTASGRLIALMSDPDAWWRFTSGPDTLSAADQQVQVTAHTVACAANDEYALMFRLTEADGLFQGYVFKLRCGGAARLERLDGTKLTTLVDWTAAPSIHSGAPADNTLLVWMAGDEFRVYVNEQYLFSAQDDALPSGTYGFYLDDQTAGGLTVEWTNLVSRNVVVDSGN